MNLTREQLEPLRDQFRERGQRPSIAVPTQAAHDLMEALRLVEEWGTFVEAMYLMMAADRRVLNVEREVLRGALAVLSDETVRTRHMEAMLDAAMRKVAREGEEKRIAKVIEELKDDPARAEAAVVLAAAIAAADSRVVPAEHALLMRLCEGLGISEEREKAILQDIASKLKTK
jgi:tellurite resistance protein